MPSLYLSLEHLPEQIHEKALYKDVAWGRLELQLDTGFEIETLLRVEWDLLYPLRWYLHTHFPNLHNSYLTYHRKPEETVAETCQRSFGQLYTYNSFVASHSFLTAFAGLIPCPKVIIALKSKPHRGEVALAINPQTNYSIAKIEHRQAPWAYEIDLRQYQQDSRWALTQFLEQWLELAPNKQKQKEAKEFFEKILALPE